MRACVCIIICARVGSVDKRPVKSIVLIGNEIQDENKLAAKMVKEIILFQENYFIRIYSSYVNHHYRN